MILILSIAAIMLGMLNGQRVRTSGIGGDMIAKPGTTSNLIGVSGAPASAKVEGVLEKLPHVQVAAPVYNPARCQRHGGEHLWHQLRKL